jgi:hypothetical protein
MGSYTFPGDQPIFENDSAPDEDPDITPVDADLPVTAKDAAFEWAKKSGAIDWLNVLLQNGLRNVLREFHEEVI